MPNLKWDTSIIYSTYHFIGTTNFDGFLFLFIEYSILFPFDCFGFGAL